MEAREGLVEERFEYSGVDTVVGIRFTDRLGGIKFNGIASLHLDYDFGSPVLKVDHGCGDILMLGGSP